MKRSDHGGGLQGCRATILSINHLLLCVINNTTVIRRTNNPATGLKTGIHETTFRAKGCLTCLQQNHGQRCGEGMGVFSGDISNRRMIISLRKVIDSQLRINTPVLAERALWRSPILQRLNRQLGHVVRVPLASLTSDCKRKLPQRRRTGSNLSRDWELRT
jgi:hypothetical protein